MIFTVEGNQLLVDIRRVAENPCSPPNEYLYGPRHLSVCVCDFPIDLVTLPGAPKVLYGPPICCETYHSHSHSFPVRVIRDPSYSEGRLECSPRVWYSPEIDASKFTLHILSDTPGGFPRLKYIFLMFHDGVTKISCTVLPDKAIITSCINSCHKATLW